MYVGRKSSRVILTTRRVWVSYEIGLISYILVFIFLPFFWDIIVRHFLPSVAAWIRKYIKVLIQPLDWVCHSKTVKYIYEMRVIFILIWWDGRRVIFILIWWDGRYGKLISYYFIISLLILHIYNYCLFTNSH